MPDLFVLDVPEFAPVVASAQSQAGLTVTSLGNYQKIHGAREITISRAATGLGSAVWFGVLVGGFAGEILEFSETQLIIGPGR